MRVFLAAASVTVAVASLASAPSAEAAPGCRVTYAVPSAWQGGFGANVTITNVGDAVNGWTLTWTFGAGQTITQLWNGSVTQSGSSVSVRDAGWNAAIATGGTASFGFNASMSGSSNPVPSDFALNGAACSGPGSGGTTTTTTSPPTTSSTTTTTTTSAPVSSTTTTTGQPPTTTTTSTSGGSGGSVGEIVAASGKCLDAGGTASGTAVRIATCNGSSQQRWEYSSSEWRSGGGSMCLDASGRGTANGTAIIIWTCGGQNNQQWTWGSNGAIVGAQSGRCVDVPNGSNTDGTAVQLYDCWGGDPQKWTLRTSGTTTSTTTTTTTVPRDTTTTTTTSGNTTTTSTSSSGSSTTAWQSGRFVVDTAGVVRRSNVVLQKANTSNTQFLPLGNGTLGAAVWAANGFTAQLNRNDTFPNRKSPGQVVIPGLSRMTGASDFKASLDLYDGILRESGGGMTMTAYMRADTDELVVDVTGADPGSSQTAQVKLWSGRSPRSEASGGIATLSETWSDSNTLGASNRTFGTMVGITAGGRNVTASAPNGSTGQVSFQPNADGSFRVVVVSPSWTGGSALSTASSKLGGDAAASSSSLSSAHLSWWHAYWGSVGLIKITSSDGSGEYFENLRHLYLYDIASINRDRLPGTQAGLADLFSFSQDSQPWYPAGYWFWNLRMFVQANISSGAFSMNTPVFTLYRSNLSSIQSWTNSYFPNHQGICVPETMRFNGNGYYTPDWAEGNASCSSRVVSFNAGTVTSGAEIGLWIWQTYLATDDKSFLADNYPIMRDSAKFLLSHAVTGSDGLLHTTSNAHETQWNVSDPVTDVAAMRALFPVVRQAAAVLGVDSDLSSSLGSAISRLRGFPTTTVNGTTVIAASAQPGAAQHNVENLGLEPVWPYNLITDNDSNTSLARNTFSRRPYPTQPDWSFDSLQAARLGLASDVKSTLVTMVGKFQAFPSGMASWDSTGLASPYLEHAGVVAATIGEALVQNYDGTLRVAPAWPSGWDVDGTVFVQHRGRVFVQIRNGTLTTFGVAAGASGTVAIRNPWPGQNVQVVDGAGNVVLSGQSGGSISLPATAGTSYLVQRASAPTTSLPFSPVDGNANTAVRYLNGRTIGLR